MFDIGDKLTKETYTAGAIGCNENGAYINEDWILCEIPTPSEEELKQIEISELKQKLSNSDYAIIKIAEGSANKEDYAELIEQRKQWRLRINELEG